MATIKFYARIQEAKQVIIEIPDLELFKQKAKDFVEEEGSLNFWNLDDELSEYCSWKYGKEYYEEENDGMYTEFDKLGIIWNDEQLLVEAD
jgi:hypothetical protein